MPRGSSRLIARVRKDAELFQKIDSDSLKNEYQRLQNRVSKGEPILSEDIVCRCFGLATEALRRATGMIYYDVQLLGGFALAAGAVAEIQTGEGKTITTGLPAILHALGGGGVHVSTTNHYLSNRDHEELTPVFEQLGLTSSCLEPQGPLPDKIQAYQCDITYGPGYEFGFDFLKDQITIRSRYEEPLGNRFIRNLRGIQISEPPLAQRGHAFAIVDEADSVLIDEATTPLIMSGGNLGIATDPSLFRFAHAVSNELCENDYEIDFQKRLVRLTDTGWAASHQRFQDRPAGRLARQWSKLVEHALRAKFLLERDVDYVVTDDKVMIVDPNTGRIHDERTWSSGLHQAVEVKENVPLTKENETQARITRQRYSRFYKGTCGLTGTASGSEGELLEFYGLPVVRIPTNKRCLRESLPTRVFSNDNAKHNGILQEVSQMREQGRATLIGTRTILESRRISEVLTNNAIPHVVLNGLQDEDEAEIVSRAGAPRAVTVATNMAGRGTDIRLSSEVRSAGGLHVAASEFHHSRRVDRQLAGRAARQGDPGSCRFFSSAEDSMIADHDPRLAARIKRSADRNGECKKSFENAILALQARIEQSAVLARQSMVEHDAWLETIQSALAATA